MTTRRNLLAGTLSGLAIAGLAGRAFAGVERSRIARPVVIGHRGAAGERPEHTFASYRRAIEAGADYVEPDLVFTKDGILVCRHENNIAETTNVATHPEFAARRTQKLIDGEMIEGWFTEDFTLAELKTLTARERLPALRPANIAYDGQATIPTFSEFMRLIAQAARETGRPIGIYPELKHPSFFEAHGFDPAGALLSALARTGLDDKNSEAFKTNPVFIQCFEGETLKKLAKKTNVPLIELISYEAQPPEIMRARLAGIARYAQGVGVEKTFIYPAAPTKPDPKPSAFVDQAHAAGLLVHIWTIRAENMFLAPLYQRGDRADPGFAARHGDVEGEIRDMLRAGIDGFFTDFPDFGTAARDQFLRLRPAR